MNSADRFELDSIRHAQTELRTSLDRLGGRIDALAGRLTEPAVVQTSPAVLPPPLPAIRPPAPIPPVAPPDERGFRPAPEATPVPPPADRVEFRMPAPQPSREPAAEAPDTGESLEMRVGTYWMARIGIVILLTGLVFLGNYAYRLLIPTLGAGGKLALLALAGGALMALGGALQRSLETMRNYGRVLLAGGAATIYYTTYAAHFVESLRVIESPLLGGGLLLGLTGLFMWYADRRRSEAVAVPALLLAYYTSAINAIGTFTLFSNLLLTTAAVVFLARHRWTRLTFLSLLATYGSYAFWHWGQLAAGPGAGHGLGLIFLACYWILFTAAVFVATPEAMPGGTRATLLTLNNAAFFVAAAELFHRHAPGSFWLFSLIYGSVLLGLAGMASRIRAEVRSLDGSYLAQGLALITLGFCAKFTGPQLAVVLAVQSAALLPLGRRRHGWLFEAASGLCAVLAFGLTLYQVGSAGARPLALGLPVAALFGSLAWWVKRLHGKVEQFSTAAAAFAALALILLAQVLWKTLPAPWLPTACVLAAAASVAAWRIRLPEVAVLGQGFLGLGLAIFFLRHPATPLEPWWSPLPLLVVTLGLMHWWKLRETLPVSKTFRELLEGICAIAFVGIGVVWMSETLHGDSWMVGTSLAAFGLLLYGSLTRATTLAIAGQLFTLLSIVTFAREIFAGSPSWLLTLVPIANVALTPLLPLRRTAQEISRTHELSGLEVLAQVYRLVALAMLGCWGFVCVAAPWRSLFFATLGVVYLGFGAFREHRPRTIIGAIYAGAALLLVWLRWHPGVFWGDLAAILLIPAGLRLYRWQGKELPTEPAVRDLLVGAAMASLWLWVTRAVNAHGQGEHLTAAWAVLALVVFSAGLGLRERIYRLGGFAILALALGRLFFIDVWQFEALARIVSFLALGVVLLVLSFVYHRFAPILRRWL